MSDDIETSNAVTDTDGPLDRATKWVLLTGDRLVVAGGITLAVTLAVYALIRYDVLTVGPNSMAGTLFGSGITSGIVTLITIALSVNQLILSRVFGSPNMLRERLDGATELRERVEECADSPASPNDPSAFLSVIGATLASRAARLQTALDAGDWSPPEELTDAVADIRTYGERIDDRLDPSGSLHDALSTILGSGYAFNLAAVKQIEAVYADDLSHSAHTELAALESLLESVAVTRQFFKTIALQEDLASLSRYVVYTGLLAFFASVSVTLVYQTGSTTVSPSVLPVVVSAGVGVVTAPLAVFSSFILRSATVASQTLSVGQFVPPGER